MSSRDSYVKAFANHSATVHFCNVATLYIKWFRLVGPNVSAPAQRALMSAAGACHRRAVADLGRAPA